MKKKAFTLIELIVGIFIISIFVWLLSLSYSKVSKNTINSKRKINLENIYKESLLLKNRWIVLSSIIEDDSSYKMWWWILWWIDITTLNKTQYSTWTVDSLRAKNVWFIVDEENKRETIIWATSFWNRFQVATNLKTSRWDIAYIKWDYKPRLQTNLYSWEIKTNDLNIFVWKNINSNFFSWDRVIISDLWWWNSITLDVKSVVWWNYLYLSGNALISNSQVRIFLNELEWLIYSTYDLKVAKNWDIVKLY